MLNFMKLLLIWEISYSKDSISLEENDIVL